MRNKTNTKEEQKALQEKLDAERAKYLRALKAVLETEAGALVFKEMFIFTRLFSTTFTGDSKIYLQEGVKHVGYKFFEDIAELNDPDLITRVVKKIMLKEE